MRVPAAGFHRGLWHRRRRDTYRHVCDALPHGLDTIGQDIVGHGIAGGGKHTGLPQVHRRRAAPVRRKPHDEQVPAAHGTRGRHPARQRGRHVLAQPVADDDMYFAVFMCKESKPRPYTIGVRDADGHSYTILRQDACMSEAVQGAGLPATRLKHCTAITVDAADTTDIVIITYKFKASLADDQ